MLARYVQVTRRTTMEHAMRYLRYSAIKVREYHKAFHSLDYLACLTKREFKRFYYNGSSALRAIRMPPMPTLLEQHRAGLTPAMVVSNRNTMMNRMQAEINWGRNRRGECIYCGKVHGESFACLSND